MIHLGLQIDFNSDRWPVTAQNWTVPLCRGEAGRGRWQSCLDLLDLMLIVQMGQNYLVLVYWTCGWEQKGPLPMQGLATSTEWQKNNHQPKSRRVPSPWNSVYSQICHALIQRVSLHLTFTVEWVWFLYLAQLLIRDYIKCCIVWWFRGFTCNCAIKGHEKKH